MLGQIQSASATPLLPQVDSPAPAVGGEGNGRLLFQILALDGGGFRGLSQAIVLAEMERRTGRATAECFDLITGTSTGGILALALALGVPAEQIVQFYWNDGKKIFPTWTIERWRRWCQWWLWPRHPAKRLREALQRCLGEDTVLGEAQTRVVIPAFDLGLRKPYLFKTDHDPRYQHDWSLPAWEIAMATSAAPTYFPYFESSWGRYYADGGLWANNPSMVGTIEATGILKQPADSVRLLNLGNGRTPLGKGRPSWLKRLGLIGWASDLPELLMQSNSISVTEASALLHGDRYLRLEPDLTDGMCPLDAYEPQALRSHALELVRQNTHRLTTFYQHHAPGYERQREPSPTTCHHALSDHCPALA